jgi:hypothetical protein
VWKKRVGLTRLLRAHGSGYLPGSDDFDEGKIDNLGQVLWGNFSMHRTNDVRHVAVCGVLRLHRPSPTAWVRDPCLG